MDTGNGVEKRKSILLDIQRVYNIAGRISKRLYIKHGEFSDRQVKNHFGGFEEAFKQAGLVGGTPQPAADKPTPTAAQGKPTETIEMVGDKMTISKISEISDLDGLIEYFKVDTDIWETERWKANIWNMGYIAKAVTHTAGDTSTTHRTAANLPLWQVTATFVKKKVVEFVKLELESLKQKFLSETIQPFLSRPTWQYHELPSGNVLEVNVPDLHAGKLAWAKETGYKDYDTNIALNTFDKAIDALLARSAHIKFDKILFVVGNDMMHSDTIAGTTTSGTQLDNDSRFHKVFVKLRDRLIDTIKFKLLPIAPVHIVGCPGNHDKLSGWHLVDSLDMYFHDGRYGVVTVDNSPEEFKFFQWGQVMLMFAHGNTGKKLDYPLTMATKQKKMWAETTYREAHTGHVHQTMVQEYHGVRVRVLPALCEPDAWHAANNFVGNLRTAEAYAWNKNEGLINLALYNAD